MPEPRGKPKESKHNSWLERWLAVANVRGNGAAEIGRDHQDSEGAGRRDCKKNRARDFKGRDQCQLVAAESQAAICETTAGTCASLATALPARSRLST